jgi:hypothetical protein
MQRDPTLEDTQRLLWTLISAPNGVAAALDGDPQVAHVRPAVDAQIEGDDRLSAVDRLEIYANMYFYRLRDCLAEDFPVVCATVGASRFHNLITDYLLVHPSTHPSLRFAGRHLPAMLTTHSLSGRWPFLAELARLEWGILDAFDAADADVLSEADLERIPPANWGELRLRLVPSTQLLHLGWSVHDTWKAVDRGDPPLVPEHSSHMVVVWRRGFRVFHRAIDTAEHDALALAQTGAPFGALCERIAERVGVEAAPAEALAFVRRWLAQEVLARA